MNTGLIKKIKNQLRIINIDKTEKIFFALFLLSIPIQTRLTFNTPQTYLNGNFNEYSTFFLYLSDIFLITTLFLFFVKLIIEHRYLTKTNNFSIKKYILHLFHTYPRFIPALTVLVTLITWSFITIFRSEYQNIALYQSFKIIELSLLFMYTGFRLKWFGINKFIWIIFISGFIESLIGIAQYSMQRSLGLKMLMESVLFPEIPNVAKIVVDGEKLIRAYGTFPHPNVFSGFLILSIFCGIWLLFSYKQLFTRKATSLTYTFICKLFHVKQFMQKRRRVKQFARIVSRETIQTDTQERGTILIQKKTNETILYILLIVGTLIQLTAFILTFSRTAWLSFVLSFCIFMFLIIKFKLFHTCPQKQFNAKQDLLESNPNKLFHVKQFEKQRKRIKQFASFIFNKSTAVSILIILVPFLVIIGFNWKQINNRTNDIQSIYQQSIDIRTLYNNIAINIIKERPIFGIGGKNFTVQMQSFYDKPLEWWQFQPTHNIYLLIAGELGIIGLILFLLFLYYVIKTSILTIKNQIVSRLPSEVNALQIKDEVMPHGKIVSRETILQAAMEGETIRDRDCNPEIVSRETIYTNTQEIETILLQAGLISIFSGFLIIGLFDHYFWTLQQGQLTFWLVLGAIVSRKN